MRLPPFVFALFVSSHAAVALAQAPASSNLEAGGLRPPDAVESSNAPPAVESEQRALEQADSEDAGRGLEFVWLNGEFGVQHLGLHTLKNDGLVDGDRVSATQTGLVYGGGVGLRLLVFTAGARFRFADFSDFQLWTLDAEFGFHVPLGNLEPYFSAAAGYASLGGVSSVSSEPSANGVDVRLAAGVDYYLSDTFSVGANVSGDVLFLSRSGEASTEPDSIAYTSDGSGIGLGVTGTAVVGLHF